MADRYATFWSVFGISSIQLANMLGKVVGYQGDLKTKEFDTSTNHMAVGQYDMLINNKYHQTLIIQR